MPPCRSFRARASASSDATAPGKSTLFQAIRGDIPIESGTDRRSAALAHRQPCAGSPERTGKPDRGGARRRSRTRRAAARGRDGARSAPDRRHPDPPRRYRRARGTGARRRDPVGTWIFDRGSVAPLRGVFRRLAHARRARGDAVRRARPAAARRADQLSRSRRHAVARRSSRALSAHRDHRQPRSRPAGQLGRPDPASRPRQADALQRRLLVVRRSSARRANCSTPSRSSGRKRSASACRRSSTASRRRPRRRGRRSRA